MNRKCDVCFYSGIICKPDNQGCKEETEESCRYCYSMYGSGDEDRERELESWAAYFEEWLLYIKEFTDFDY